MIGILEFFSSLFICDISPDVCRVVVVCTWLGSWQWVAGRMRDGMGLPIGWEGLHGRACVISVRNRKLKFEIAEPWFWLVGRAMLEQWSLS
jgi:hypothetical protein